MYTLYLILRQNKINSVKEHCFDQILTLKQDICFCLHTWKRSKKLHVKYLYKILEPTYIYYV